tara:strand:- start:57 stop:182 length:126 start_codon:yes stop_codon:yes gene_type:complete
MRGDFLRRRKHAERINQKYRAFRVFLKNLEREDTILRIRSK